MWRQRKSWRVKRRHGCHLIGLESWLPLSEKLRRWPPKKRTVQPGDAFEDTTFKQEVWKCQILNHVVESQLFTSFCYKYHQWLSDIEFIQTRAFSASYSRMNPCFTDGKWIRVWNCQATCGHWKTTVFTSVVHGCSSLILLLVSLVLF